MNGWGKIKQAAKYADISERTLRGDWLKNGLRHSRLPSGTILIQFSAIDEYLKKFEVTDNEVEKTVKEVCEKVLK